MRILYIAFACDPYAGSEAQVGWSWALAMRQYTEVYIITRNENKEPIERYMNEKEINDIHVFYHDIPSWMNIYYKKWKLYHLFYLMWQKTLKSAIRELNKTYKFDYIHHVSLGDFRSISGSWKLPTQFIFGPVGGVQLTPEVFRPYIGNKKSEITRKWINYLIGVNPFYRRALNRCSYVFAANRETHKFLQKRMRNKERCVLLTENGIQANKLDKFVKKNKNSRIVILWAGRMVKRKGLSFLMDVLKEVKTNTPFIVKLAGDGPEMDALKAKAAQLGIENKIEFVGKLPFVEMRQLYSESDIFVFPSYRETTGTVLFEAMSAAIPIVTFNQNGADLLIDETCGIKVSIEQSLSNIINEFALSLKKLIEDPVLRSEMGSAALNKMKGYTWESKCIMFYNTYLNGNTK